MPRNTATLQSVNPLTTDSTGGVADTVVQLTDDNSGGSDANNNGEAEDEPEDGDKQQRKEGWSRPSELCGDKIYIFS